MVSWFLSPVVSISASTKMNNNMIILTKKELLYGISLTHTVVFIPLKLSNKNEYT